MAYRLPPLPVLRAFEAAARHLSFKRAAEELHVTPAAVSQQIKALEDYLGVPLFRRLTRALELTEYAVAMLPKVREGFDCLAAAIDSTRHQESGSLTITAPPSFATHWLVPRLPRFAGAHPEIVLRLSSSRDSVDRRGETALFDEALIDPRTDASTIAIRYGTGSYPGYCVDRILSTRYVVVCAPALLAGDRRVRGPHDLADQVLIHDETIDDDERPSLWQEWLQTAGVSEIDAGRGPRYSNAVLAVEAALAGQGFTLVPDILVAADIAAGRLVKPFDIALPSPYAYFMVTAEAVARRAAVAAFRRWLLDEAASA